MNDQIPTKKYVLRIFLRFILCIGILVLVFAILPTFLKLFFPFILAAIAASIISPLLERFSRQGSKLWNFWSMVFVIILLLIIAGILGAVVYYLATQIIDLVGNWDQIQADFTSAFNSASRFIGRHIQMPGSIVKNYAENAINSLLKWISDQISDWAQTLFSSVGSMASSVAGFFVAFLFFLVGVYFITSDYHNIYNWVSKRIPELIRPHMHQIKMAAKSATFGYFTAQAILSAVIAVIIFFVLLAIGQSYASLIAIICGIIDFIPFFGSGIVLIPWAIIAICLGNYSKGVILIILSAGIFLIRKVAEPKVVGDQTGLPPLVSLISIYVGLRLGGVAGMILVPILSMIIISLNDVGFFDPTIQDIKVLLKRILNTAKIDSNDAPAETADVPDASLNDYECQNGSDNTESS